MALLATAVGLWQSTWAAEVVTLPPTPPLTAVGDLSAQMVEGIDRFLMREIDHSIKDREALWHRDTSSKERYESSVEPNREHFRKIIGAVEPQPPVTALEYISTTAVPAKIAETETFVVYAVRWTAFDLVHGEGLLLEPKTPVQARIVAIPDADQTPEMLAGLAAGVNPVSQFARRLAENGCQVLVPTLISREDTWSGNEALHRFTNQPHREWIYRQAFELGRHVIGYEVQKVLAAVDWFNHLNEMAEAADRHPIGVIGYGEGGLIGFYSAALDRRIDATLVSGYFGPRQRVWEEPIYRNVFRLLAEFGDAEIASLIAPRALIVEHSEWPKVDGPPPARPGRAGAAPGKLVTPERIAVENELDRVKAFFPETFPFHPELIYANEGQTTAPGSNAGLAALLEALHGKLTTLNVSSNVIADARPNFDAGDRQKRQLAELVAHTQRLLLLSEQVRDDFFWRKTQPSPTSNWAAVTQPFKDIMWDDLIGRFPPASLPANPRARQIYDREKWTGYEVMLDVWPDVYAWGILLLPKDLKPGERRPVVVCQHGLEGVPIDTIEADVPGVRAYQSFAARLAEQGFITFAPHNPYRGEDKFRVLQRKANPLGRSLFSVILAQHDRILDYLSGLPFVDPERIGFYGLSYGGKTAMRVPPLLKRYCLSICSADFDEWVKKNATTDSPYSYLFTGEYEMVEFNLGHLFNYAEMAALIAPRPFMVERGHHDGVAPDEWVAYEYAKVRRCYAYLGIPDRTQIEFFNGPHTIHGVGTFDFLHRHLRWPPPQ